MSEKHTKLPWVVAAHLDGYPAKRPIDVRSAETNRQIACTYNQTRPHLQYPFEECEANAAFICRAVNAHYDLLAACREALADLVLINAHHGGLGEQLRNAISLAQPTQEETP